MKKLSENPDEILTGGPLRRVKAKEIAGIYDVTPAYIYQLAKKGKIPCIKVGGSVRFDRAAVIASLEEIPIEKGQAALSETTGAGGGHE